MASSTDDTALVEYEKLVLRSLENAKATQPHKSLFSGRDLNTMATKYWAAHEPTKPRPAHFSSVGFRSLTGSHGLLDYLEQKKYVKCHGARFEILSTNYQPGVPQGFLLRRRSSLSSFTRTRTWDFDEDAEDFSDDLSHNGGRFVSRGSTADNFEHMGDSDVDSTAAAGGGMMCPSCLKNIVGVEINSHLDECLTRKLLEEEKNARRDDSDSSAPSSPQRRAMPAKRKLSNRVFSGLDSDPLMQPPSATRPKLNGSSDSVQVNPAPGPQRPAARAPSPDPHQLGARVSTQILDLAAALSPPPMVKKDSQDFDPRFAARTLKISIPEKECQICLDTFEAGNVIATLHCMCMFHKKCLLAWFAKNESCPNHPDLDLHSGL